MAEPARDLTAPARRAQASLQHGRIGLREVLFQSLSAMAPAASVAFSLILGAAYAGGALCLSVLLALLPCLSVAVSLGQMSRHLPTAGAFFTFPARALHPTVGFLAAWGYIYVAGTAGGGVALLIGLQLHGAFSPAPGAASALLWAAGVVLPLLLVFALSVRGIRASARAGTLVGLAETVVVCAIAVALLVAAGGFSLEPFTPRAARVPGFEGMKGVVAGAVYAMLAFSGFEGAAPLAEETRNPRANILRAMVLSCLAGAAIYVFTTYAATMTLGADGMARFGLSDEGTGWVPLAERVWRPFSTLLALAFLSSLFGNQNAAFNSLTRTWFSMGRSGVLPRALARTHPRHGSPHVAAAAQLALCLAVAALAIPFGAQTIIVLNATATTVLLIVCYMLANLSCMVFFLRERRADLRPWLHLAVPAAGIAALVPALCTSLGVGASIFPFVTPLTGAAALTGWVIAGWMLAGAGVLALLAWRRPGELARGGAVLLGDEPR